MNDTSVPQIFINGKCSRDEDLDKEGKLKRQLLFFRKLSISTFIKKINFSQVNFFLRYVLKYDRSLNK